MKREDRRNWRELKARLFKPAQPRWGEDAFVNAVMARIAETETPSMMSRLGLWLKMPALVVASVLILMVTPLPEETAPSLEMVLLGEEADQPIGHLYSGAVLESEDLIGIYRRSDESNLTDRVAFDGLSGTAGCPVVSCIWITQEDL